MKTLKERAEDSYREYQERTLGEACPCYSDGYNTGAEEFRRMVLEELQTTIDESPTVLGKDAQETIDIAKWLMGNIRRLGLEVE